MAARQVAPARHATALSSFNFHTSGCLPYVHSALVHLPRQTSKDDARSTSIIPTALPARCFFFGNSCRKASPELCMPGLLSHKPRRQFFSGPTKQERTAARAMALEADLLPLNSKQAAEQQNRELHSLNVAIGANILIFVAKLWVHVMTGSSSMLAEALHSIADVGNQALLRIGVQKAQRAPTAQHPYGYARDRFIWSLISAVGIFFLGAGASFYHGIHELTATRELEGLAWNYVVLGVSAVLESYSLYVASKYVFEGARARKMNVLEYIRSGVDPTTVAVMLEDGGAVMGLAIAGACTGLAQATGNAMYDALGSILVGCLLGVIATFLVQKNRTLLIGRSMPPKEVLAVLSHLRADSVVSYVKDTKTEEIGPSIYRFKAEVAWNGNQVVERYLERCGRDHLVRELADASKRGDTQTVEYLLKAYGRDIINAVGAEVDRIEQEIQVINPGILYVDLETDRGRHEGRRQQQGALEMDLNSMDFSFPDGASSMASGDEVGGAQGYTCSVRPAPKVPPII